MGQVGVVETQTKQVHTNGVVVNKWEEYLGCKGFPRAVRGPSPMLGPQPKAPVPEEESYNIWL